MAAKTPAGLDMSLDDFIKLQQKEEREKKQKQQPQQHKPAQPQVKVNQGAHRKPFHRDVPGPQQQQGGRGRGNGRGGLQHRLGVKQQQQPGRGVGMNQHAMMQPGGFMGNGVGNPMMQQQMLMQMQQRQQQQQQQQRQIAMQQQLQLQKSQQQRHGARCYVDKMSGDVCVKLKDTAIIVIRPTGEVVLNSGGWATQMTLQAMNNALAVLGIKITAIGDVTQGNWSVSDGRSLARFADGMVIPAKGLLHQGRGEQVLQASQNGWQQVQQQQVQQQVQQQANGLGLGASLAAGAGLGAAGLGAAAAGLGAAGLLGAGMGAAGLAGAVQAPGAAGNLLSLQQQYLALQQQVLASQLLQQQQQQQGSQLIEDEYLVGEAQPSGFGKDTDAIRRLKAQGRYAPY